MAEHLVFYDGECGLCDHAVQFILKRDNKEIFAFAPLQGITAKKWLEKIPESMRNEDSLVLIENYEGSAPKVYILANGALRICWLLGGMWSMLGILSWLPPWSVNWAYRIVARNRKRLFSNDRCVLPAPQTKHRFLP